MPQTIYKMPSLASIAQSNHYRNSHKDDVASIEVVVNAPEKAKGGSKAFNRFLRFVNTTLSISFNIVGFLLLSAIFISCVSLTSFLLVRFADVNAHSTARTQTVPYTEYHLDHGQQESNIKSIEK